MTTDYLTWDCFTGEHHWCTGTAWDEQYREPTPCACRCHLPPETHP